MLDLTPEIFTMTEIVYRLGTATLLGMVLGVDREVRGFVSGMRTHALVAVSSAAITLSALMIFEAVRATEGEPGVDPLRVIQGLAQAIGFIAAGGIFVSQGSVRNLTTAANLWLAASVGIAAGAAQYGLAVIGTGLGVFIVTVVWLAELLLPWSPKSRED
ncbi:MAG TPA: MgtC/SapB family protein [Azospirillaceae bacterium]|nr:MgtC/SapB family protein [Azospirillaceae bacterium]